MDECSNYVQGYALTEERYVATLSSFLKGKAYRYYTMMVSKDASAWSLAAFFRGLFDFCFPENGLIAFRLGKPLGTISFIQWLGEENYQDMVNFTLKYTVQA